ncbi:hypothetical protein [Thioalkalivibrio sp. XN279]|uniref:hypothetical protein n=1 Tax=Thioalkalivibrio sp. XN279 TaxID=2714953 RepID=UPI0014089938|nr:hypothetical protein [Thioalkalivibrio sp. XN279]NHA14617.1 hypothetical protein [Thioalkalivibrio sp. XN279]
MSYELAHASECKAISPEANMMRALIFVLFCVVAVPTVHADDDDPVLAFSVGGFSGDDTSGIAVGVYSLQPNRLGWYVNATISSLIEDDEYFRPIPGDIRVDSDTDSITLSVGLTWSVSRVTTYFGAGFSSVGQYGLYRTPSFSYWYEESTDTKGNFNAGLLFGLSQSIGLDVGANSANEEVTLGLNWRF